MNKNLFLFCCLLILAAGKTFSQEDKNTHTDTSKFRIINGLTIPKALKIADSATIFSGKIIKLKTGNLKPLETKEKNKAQSSNRISSVQSVSSQTFSTSSATDAGRTMANIDVTGTGALTYTVPIAIPPGIGGVTPQIALTYNSQGGSGIAGYGWNIAGLSSITRIPSTKFHDNKISGVNFDSDDRFALDGQRLILKSGVYGGDGAEYQTENYSNLKIISKGVSSYGATYGPAYFEVYYPDGSKSFYGYNSDSKTQTDFALSYSENALGIRINFTYNLNDNVLTIQQVGFGSKGTLTPVNKVEFVYTDRIRKDFSKATAVLFTQTKILKTILVTSSTMPYRRYELTHDYLPVIYHERLKQLQEFNGNGNSFEPIIFNYNNTSDSVRVSPMTLDADGISKANYGVVTADFTGDGTLDFILYPATKDKVTPFMDPTADAYNTQYATSYTTGAFKEIFPISYLTSTNKLASGQGFVLVKEWSNTSIKFEVKSTGISSPLLNQYEKIWTNAGTNPYYSNCTNTSSLGAKIEKNFLSGDFDGDGLTDIIAINKPYYKDRVEYFMPCSSGQCCTTQTYNQEARSEVHLVNLNRSTTTGFVQLTGYLETPWTDGNKFHTGDFNGDGKTDILHITPGMMYIYGLTEANGLRLLWKSPNSRISQSWPSWVADYNGDGKTDIMFPTIYTHTSTGDNLFALFMSNGKQFDKAEKIYPFGMAEPTYDWTFNSYREFTLIPNDINRDGITDIIRLETTTYNDGNGHITIGVFHNIGMSSTVNAPQFHYSGYHYSREQKLGHLPIPILLNSDKPNHNMEFGLISDKILDIFESQRDVKEEVAIKSISQNGLVYNADYKFLTGTAFNPEISLYRQESNQVYPYIDIENAPGFKVVSKLNRVFNNVQTQQIFAYRGAVSNTQGLGFQGFSKTIKSNWHINYSDNNRIFNISINDPHLRGAAINTLTTKNPFVTDSGQGSNITDYITSSTYTYSTQLLADKQFINVPTLVSVNDKLSGTTTTQTYSYDSFYNVTKQISSFSAAGTKTVDITYDNNPAGGYIGRPLTKKTTHTNAIDSYGTEEQYSYTGYLPTQIKKKGNGTSFITESLQYDTYGNVTNKIVSTAAGIQRATQMQYDAGGRFLTKIIDPEGLETTMQYDAITGNITTKLTPYDYASNAYDTWGRLVQTTNQLGVKSYRSYQRSGSDILIQEYDDEGSEKYTNINALGETTETAAKDALGQLTGKAFLYDIYGRVFKVSEPAIGRNYTQVNETVYDEYGRIKQATAFTGKITNISYNGLSTTVNDGTKSVTTTKNALGQVISTTDPGGTITNTYFANGNLKSVDYEGSVQTIEQDGWGRKTKLTDPSAGVYTYAYNDFGEVTQETTPKGSTTYTYDTNGKLQTKRIQGDNTDMTYQYTYHADTKLLSSYTLQNTDGNNAVYSYTYDNLKRLTSSIEDNAYARFARTLTYDSFGRVSTEASEAKYKLNNKIAARTVQNNYQFGQMVNITDQLTGVKIWELTGLNARGQVTATLLAGALRNFCIRPVWFA